MPEISINDVKSPFELIQLCNNEPEPIFYWRGIEDVSFGYVFGPSKAGTTIFCENLAMSLTVGKDSFFNSPMIGQPKKVFFAAMEESYRNRVKRMQKQMSFLNDDEKELYNANMILAGKNFPRTLTTNKQWSDFEELIIQETPDVVIIDSFTRIMNEDITNRVDCKKVLARLRNFAYNNSLCLIVIHHSTKNSGKPLVMDSMAGSSVMSQEADFSIGLNHNEFSAERYVKEVFYRYEETNDMVITYSICNDTNWLIPSGFKYENKIVNNTGVESANNYDMVINYLESKAEELSKDKKVISYKIQVSELKNEFVSTKTMPARTFDYTLKNIVKNGILVPDGKLGNYTYLIDDSSNLRNSRNDNVKEIQNEGA